LPTATVAFELWAVWQLLDPSIMELRSGPGGAALLRDAG